MGDLGLEQVRGRDRRLEGVELRLEADDELADRRLGDHGVAVEHLDRDRGSSVVSTLMV